MGGVWLRRKLLQTADALAGEFVHPPHKLRRRRGDVVIGPGVDLQDARGFAGPESGLKLCAVDKRNLAEEVARQAHAKLALDSIDQLDDFDCPREHDKERWRFALIDRVFAGAEIDIRGHPRDIRERDRRKGGKNRKRDKFIWRQHALLALVARSGKNAGALSWGHSPLCQAADAREPAGALPNVSSLTFSAGKVDAGLQFGSLALGSKKLAGKSRTPRAERLKAPRSHAQSCAAELWGFL